MSLFIPTSERAIAPFPLHIAKGQLYNLDNNEFINFQFNPTAFEWERQIKWNETNWKGDSTGGDLDYLFTSPRTFELSLLYVADPGAPSVEYNSNERIMNNGIVDFQSIIRTIESWEQPLEGIGRPSKILIVFGPNSFQAVITTSNMKITDFFEDLSPKEALLSLDLREWITR